MTEISWNDYIEEQIKKREAEIDELFRRREETLQKLKGQVQTDSLLEKNSAESDYGEYIKSAQMPDEYAPAYASKLRRLGGADDTYKSLADHLEIQQQKSSLSDEVLSGQLKINELLLHEDSLEEQRKRDYQRQIEVLKAKNKAKKASGGSSSKSKTQPEPQNAGYSASAPMSGAPPFTDSKIINANLGVRLLEKMYIAKVRQLSENGAKKADSAEAAKLIASAMDSSASQAFLNWMYTTMGYKR